ncbi:MAG: hypothetical protein WCF33_23815 [Pseudonocardiaceae bacterium]
MEVGFDVDAAAVEHSRSAVVNIDDHGMGRRGVLGFLSWATATASLLASVDGDGQQRVTSVLTTSSRLDAQTIEHIETVLWHCRCQDHALGPKETLNTV